MNFITLQTLQTKMPFQKGRQKTGGRKKGTPNKINPDDILACDIYDVRELEFFTGIAKHFFMVDYVDLQPKERIALWKSLLPYILKKPK
jgi:hypothetical protein